MEREPHAFSAMRRTLEETEALVDRVDAEMFGVDSEEPESTRDGSCLLEISEDKMTVRADFFPAIGVGSPFSLKQLEDLLRERSIIHGEVLVPDQELSGIGVIVALGTPPQEELPERIEILPSLINARKVVDGKTHSFDFKEQSAFIQVHVGDLLARRLPCRPGIAGRDVEGTLVPFQEALGMKLSPGKNVLESGDAYKAECNGTFCLAKSRFWIEKVLILANGVNYHTGHIDFDGDVELSGDVAAGFNIHIQGSLRSSQTVDFNELVCGGDIVASGGLIGRAGSSLRAGGKVAAKFLENAKVTTPRSIEIETGVLNCHLQTLDRLVMGSRGVLVGTRVEAQNGVEVFQLGNSEGAKSSIVCGMDFQAVEKMEWVRGQSLLLVRQLKALENYKLTRHNGESNLNKATAKVRTQILKLHEMSRRLVSQIDKNEEASILVRGMAFAGSSIEICHVCLLLRRPVSRVRFFLDKARGEIRNEAI